MIEKEKWCVDACTEDRRARVKRRRRFFREREKDKEKFLNDGSYELRAVGLPAQHLSQQGS